MIVQTNQTALLNVQTSSEFLQIAPQFDVLLHIALMEVLLLCQRATVAPTTNFAQETAIILPVLKKSARMGHWPQFPRENAAQTKIYAQNGSFLMFNAIQDLIK